MAESRAEDSGRLLKAFEAWELKLKVELATLRYSFETTIQELEA